MDSSSSRDALVGRGLDVLVQHPDHEQHSTGDKGFLNVIVAAHVSEASLVRVNVGNAFLADSEICESLLSNLLCQTRHDRRL